MFDFLIFDFGFKHQQKDVYVLNTPEAKTTITVARQEHKDFANVVGFFVVDIVFNINFSEYYRSNLTFGFVSEPKDVENKIKEVLNINSSLLKTVMRGQNAWYDKNKMQFYYFRAMSRRMRTYF